MENASVLMIMLMTVPALVAAIIVGVNAKKLNAQWRAKREAKKSGAVDGGEAK